MTNFEATKGRRNMFWNLRDLYLYLNIFVFVSYLCIVQSLREGGSSVSGVDFVSPSSPPHSRSSIPAFLRSISSKCYLPHVHLPSYMFMPNMYLRLVLSLSVQCDNIQITFSFLLVTLMSSKCSDYCLRLLKG